MNRKSAEALLGRAARALARDRRILFAYAYGSILTRRDARDLDIAVYLSGASDPWRTALDVAGDLEQALGRGIPLDLNALNAAAPAFAFSVISRGRLLWEKDRSRRLEWEAHALSSYQDVKPMLDFHDRRFLSP